MPTLDSIKLSDSVVFIDKKNKLIKESANYKGVKVSSVV